jgi:hypothetical protein
MSAHVSEDRLIDLAPGSCGSRVRAGAGPPPCVPGLRGDVSRCVSATSSARGSRRRRPERRVALSERSRRSRPRAGAPPWWSLSGVARASIHAPTGFRSRRSPWICGQRLRRRTMRSSSKRPSVPSPRDARKVVELLAGRGQSRKPKTGEASLRERPAQDRDAAGTLQASSHCASRRSRNRTATGRSGCSSVRCTPSREMMKHGAPPELAPVPASSRTRHVASPDAVSGSVRKAEQEEPRPVHRVLVGAAPEPSASVRT